MRLDQAFYSIYKIHWRCDQNHIFYSGMITIQPYKCAVCQSPLVQAVMERK